MHRINTCRIFNTEHFITGLSHVAEPHMSQCNTDQWDCGLCGGPGDESSAVQPALRHICLDVSRSPHWLVCTCGDKMFSKSVTVSPSDYQKCSRGDYGRVPDWQIRKSMWVCMHWLTCVMTQKTKGNNVYRCVLQSGCFSSLFSVFWAHLCLPSVPTSEELPTSFHSCLQDVYYLVQAMDLWPVRDIYTRIL